LLAFSLRLSVADNGVLNSSSTSICFTTSFTALAFISSYLLSKKVSSLSYLHFIISHVSGSFIGVTNLFLASLSKNCVHG